ncbi:MAG: hypothetical protein AUI47_04010 [Acidobacteria bacterium 13_1_40CM_2_68_5]|nr:MAG: hypothetical protein AUI47_04010 [Acidobacteria bacterium 13_1_40CM_2_68_5]
MSRLPAGPAADIAACRSGWRLPHSGSYGVEAQPIMKPDEKKVSSGTTSVPIGSRRMCGHGLSETCPP